jgi:2-polyprenyl-3-methyl-5-hydroxy-6-metoxy-1,4-benzoquinol methylase
MLDRVLEPEVMDTEEEARVYDAMDHSAVNAVFVADFLAAHGPCRGGEVLDVGTGTALIPIALARADAKVRVRAIDLARHMIELSRRNISEAGLAGRIVAELADAKDLARQVGAEVEGFEAVISNSIVHHVPEPRTVLREMARLVAPGGTLFVRDLARPGSIIALHDLVATYAGGEPEFARALFAASLHAALTVDEVRSLVAELGMPAEGVRMTSDRHWTWAWRRP